MMEMMWYYVIWCTWCDMIWKEIMWYGMTWCYMLWYGVDWNDVIWCSVFRLSHVILLRCTPRSLPSFPTPACPASSNDEGKIAMICRCCFHNLCKCLLQKNKILLNGHCWTSYILPNIYIYIMFLADIVIAHWGLWLIYSESFRKISGYIHHRWCLCPLPGHYAHHGSKQH